MVTHQTQNANVPAVIDSLAANDPTDNPAKGTDFRFKGDGYESFGEKIDVEGESYVVIDRVQGWQKLEKGCPPEYLIRQAGQPKPAQPHVDKEAWPLDLNGKPSHPWKWTNYLYLLNTTTGEFSTFSTNTIGGSVALGELSDQVALMRSVRPGAVPIVALCAKDMPTQYGGTKPRPYFKILGWKAHGGSDQAQLASPEMRAIEAPSLAEELNDSVDHI